MLIGTGSCGTRTRDCFHPRWQCWRSLCWVEGWWCQCYPGCCCVAWRGGPSPPAAALPEPAAAPAAAASGAAGAGKLRAPTSLSVPLLHASHRTAETTALQETRRKQAALRRVNSRAVSSLQTGPVRICPLNGKKSPPKYAINQSLNAGQHK